MKYAAVIKRGHELYDLAIRLKKELAGSERHLLRKKQNCSRAGKILTYLNENENCTKKEAQEILQELTALGVLTKITRNKGKEGDGTLYRFPSNDDKYTQFLEILLEDSREQSAIGSRQVRNLEFKQTLLIRTAVISVLINFFFILIILDVSLVVHIFFFACLIVTGYYMFYFNPHQPFQHLRQQKENSEQTEGVSTEDFDKHLHQIVDDLKKDPTNDADLQVQIQKLGDSLGTKGFFISRTFCDAMVGTFEYDKRIASRICSQNINLLSYTGWTRHQINAQNLEHVLKIGFVKLLPIQGADKSWILYISSSRCDLYTHTADLWSQIMYYMCLKTCECPEVSVNMITMVADLSSVPFRQFRKVASRDVEVAKRFTDTPATKFKFLYFVNVPIWLKLIKMCIPSKYMHRCKFVNSRQLCEDLGNECLPVDVGGVLEEQDWARQVDRWIEEEKPATPTTQV